MALRHGRGNNINDAEPSGGYNRIGTDASYKVALQNGKPNLTKLAGAAMAYGAGNCDQNAVVSQRLHASRMQPHETATQVHSPAMGHTWTETNAPNRPTIVIDPWAAGPAARKQDTDWASLTDTKVKYHMDRQQAQTERQEMLKHRQDFLPGGSSWPESQAALQAAKARPNAGTYGANNQVIDPQFAQNARDKLQTMHPLHREILAAGAARESYNLNVAAATAKPTTDTLLGHAENLDNQGRMRPQRPTKPLV